MERVNKLLLVVATVAVLFTSCKKDELPEDRLSGEWLMHSVSLKINHDGIGGEWIENTEHYQSITFKYASAFDVTINDVTYHDRYVFMVTDNKLLIDGKGLNGFRVPKNSEFSFRKGIKDTLILKDLDNPYTFKYVKE
ncbi:hypothetical protein [Sphingobacterium sp.]|uniref:hypothetical protein n=1 Tax=Sphingobacterium sp. TaxID=341027 RepID=UPI0028A76070|nr:hypothetical protein [Sphingobacterium sp.]